MQGGYLQLPNWVHSDLFILGKKYILKELESSEFDFVKLRSPPDKVSYVSDLKSNLLDKLFVVSERKLAIQKLKKFEDDFRTNDFWYDKNWGCSNRADYKFEWKNHSEVYVYLMTAWRAPFELLRYLSEIYPIMIHHTCSDPLNDINLEFEYQSGRKLVVISN